jgi:hypothetical protein
MRSLKTLRWLLLGLVFCYASASAQDPAVRFTATSANVSGAGEAIRINLSGWSSDAQRDQLVGAWTLTSSAAAPAAGRGGRGGGARGAGARGGRGGRGGAPADSPAPAGNPTADLPADPDAVDADNPAFRFGRGGARGRGDAPAQTPEASLAAALKKAPTIGVLWTSETVGYSIKYAYRIQPPGGGERIILATDRRVGAWSNLWKPAPNVPASDYAFSIIELLLNAGGQGEGKGVVGGKIVVDSDAKSIALDGYTALPVILKSVKRVS